MKHALLSLVVFLAATPALASEATPGFYATLGANAFNPNAHEFSTEVRPALGLGYAFDRNWAIEAGVPLRAYHERVSVDGLGPVASLRVLPVEASVLHHFSSLSSSWSPYVGLGYAWARTTDEYGTGAFAGVPVEVDNLDGPLARVGADWSLAPDWFARLDATYLDLDTHAFVDGARSGRIPGNTWQYAVAVGYRF